MKHLTLLFLLKENSILLAMKKRGFGEGKWNGVGGKVEPGESIKQALVRETQEEISVTPQDYDQVAKITFTEFVDGATQDMLVHVFVCHKWQGEPVESEEMKPQWFNIDKIPYEQMWPDDPYWLPLIIQNKKVIASFTLDEHNTITQHKVEEVTIL